MAVQKVAMKRAIQGFGVFLAAVSVTFSWGCQEGGVGDPCIPEDEYDPEFAGFSKDEVNIESRSFQCRSRTCLVANFEGRVSCKYGQDEATAPSDRCKTPDLTLDVTVPVPAQLESRRPRDAVYCSCRCAGAQTNAPYCECPSGFECKEVFPNVGLGDPQLAGSYCVRNGTYVDDPGKIPVVPCDRAAESCGDATSFD